jgi:hypothetical protein
MMKTPAKKLMLRPTVNRHFGWAFVLIILLGGTRSVGQANSSTENIASATAPASRTERATTASPTLPTCPAGMVSSGQSALARNSRHSVTLSWNASAPPSKTETAPVGYCVYRRKASAARTQANATIADRERISVAPVTGTSCVDDQVADDGQYYYVITAINAKGAASSPTKEAPAAIPNKDLATAPAVSAPLCRGASAMN